MPTEEKQPKVCLHRAIVWVMRFVSPEKLLSDFFCSPYSLKSIEA